MFFPAGGGSAWSGGGVLLGLGGWSAWSGGVLLGPGGVLLGGVSLGGSPWGGFSGDPPVNRITDTCKNITLATTSLRPVKMEIVISLNLEGLQCEIKERV